MISWKTFVLAIMLASLPAPGQNQITNATWTLNSVPTYVAPGEIVTLTTTALNVPDATATQIPLPTALSGVSVTARVVGAQIATGYPASLPILNVRSSSGVQFPSGPSCANAPGNIVCDATAITVQIPTEGVCAPPPDNPPLPCTNSYLPPLLILNVVANGVTGPDFPVMFQNQLPHPLNSCDSIFGLGASELSQS